MAESLKSSNDFQKILKKGKWYGEDNISVYIVKNNLKKNLIGIAVGKKVAKSVRRNRIKRVIREAYRLNESKLILGNSIVIVWKTKNSLEKATLLGIEHDLIDAFTKAGIVL